MQKYFLGLIFLILMLSACTTKTDPSATTSIRFTPLNFPYSNLGEFTLTDSGHKEQINIFLNVILNTLKAENQTDTTENRNLSNTFTLQLYTKETLTAIYRLSFDFENDSAYLQDAKSLYLISKVDFYQLMETGYFNVIFHKNYAPNAIFELNGIEVKYAVSGTWNYETYQNNFLSYQINKKLDQSTNYIVTDRAFDLRYRFTEKQPDQIFETISTADSVFQSKTLLSSDRITIPSEENHYFYEIEAVWDNTDLPYRAVLTYRFDIEVNYPAKINLPTFATAGSILPIIIENYDTNGKISIVSSLWKEELSLYELNGKFYGILPIPYYTKEGEYEIQITGRFSNEFLQKKEIVTVASTYSPPKILKGKAANQIAAEEDVDRYFDSIVRKSFLSSPEKLWGGKFATPTTTAPSISFGTSLQHEALFYQYFRLSYPNKQPFDVRASESGIIRALEPLQDGRYILLVDHGLSVHSIYYGVSDLEVGLGSFLSPKQKIGTYQPDSKLADMPFRYAMIANGYYINPNAFRNRDPFSIFKK